jgi:DNA-binding NarL/FixJ family response regulator
MTQFTDLLDAIRQAQQGADPVEAACSFLERHRGERVAAVTTKIHALALWREGLCVQDIASRLQCSERWVRKAIGA